MHMRFSPTVAAALTGLLGVTSALAQAPAPAGAKNLVSNGSFETSFRRENLWAGTDSSGYLAGQRGAVPILTTSGAISESSMPVSVSLADMNADGKLDIVAMDVLGYLHIYFNQGTPQEAKFATGDLSGLFLTRIDSKDPVLNGAKATYARLAPRAFATDMLKSGKKDLIVGNYLGEIFAVPNAGSPQSPDFRQPPDPSRLLVPTTKDSNNRWGNVFSPAVWDWNRDGKDDLILGEGSYSANNIHLLVNQGSGSKPVFDENNHHIIAYGDGLEQLAPCVVDYNGDNQPDLLVAERTGKIAIYLNSGDQWKIGGKPPEVGVLKGSDQRQFVGGASALNFGGICTVATGDLNGDGLFDLVVGKTNGRIAIAMNTGSKTEPKFGAPVELKGDPSVPFAVPSGWDVDYGERRGNFFGFVSVVKGAEDKNAAPSDGAACLKAGYLPTSNKVMPVPSVYTGAFPKFDLKEPSFTAAGASEVLNSAPARYFMIRQLGRFRLGMNKNYTLSFKVKGRASEGQAIVGWTGYKKLSEARVTQGERGSADVRENTSEDQAFETVKFTPGAGWSEVRKDFRVSLKNKELADLKEATTSLLQISFSMQPGDEVYFDDVKIIER